MWVARRTCEQVWDIHWCGMTWSLILFHLALAILSVLILHPPHFPSRSLELDVSQLRLKVSSLEAAAKSREQEAARVAKQV